ncbi:MAG: hypothetical protein JJU35_09380 [Balneolales bacterium]|nr:hypothetical protein [Balneolales bacterium]
MKLTARINKQELKKAIRQVRFSLDKYTKGDVFFRLELDIHPEMMTLRAPGASVPIEAHATGFGRYLFPIYLLKQLTKPRPEEPLVFTIADRYLKVEQGPEIIRFSLIEYLSGRASALPELPMNYTDRHVLALRARYTDHTLRDMGVGSQLQKALLTFDDKLYAAFEELKLYGVTIEELKTLAERKIRE